MDTLWLVGVVEGYFKINIMNLENTTTLLTAIAAILSIAIVIDLYVKGNKLKNENK